MRVAGHRAVEQQLVEGEFALEDIAFRQADFRLDFARCAHFHVQDAVAEARRIIGDLADDRIGKGIAIGVRPVAAFDLSADNTARNSS